MGPPDGTGAGFGQAEMQHFSLLHQFLHRTCHLLHRNIRVHPVLVKQVNVVGTQTPEGTFYRTPDMVGPAVQGRRTAFLHAKTEFGSYPDLVADRGESLPHPFLTGIRPVHFRRIKKSNPFVKSPAYQGNHLLFIILAAVITHHRQTSQPDRGNFQASKAPGFPKKTLLRHPGRRPRTVRQQRRTLPGPSPGNQR